MMKWLPFSSSRSSNGSSNSPSLTSRPKPVSFEDVELSLEQAMRRQRPQGATDARRWDIDVGDSYRGMGESLAWKHMYDTMLHEREKRIQALLAGGEEGREAIKLLDLLLKLPAVMAERGKRARQEADVLQESV